MTVDLLNMFPEHHIMHITHNGNRAFYDSMAEYLQEDYIAEFITQEERKKCLESGQIWEIQIYPITPISFYKTVASTLEIALQEMTDILKPQSGEACEACSEEQDACQENSSPASDQSEP